MILPGLPRRSSAVSHYALALLTVLALGLVTACGGGGGSSDPRLSVNNPTVVEGNETDTTEVIFTLTLNKRASRTLTVNVATADGTASGSASSGGADADYESVDQTLTIARGSQSASISIYVNGDNELEAHETFNLIVSNPQGLKLDSGSQRLTGTATITNDEAVNPQGYFNGSGTLNGADYDDITALIYDSRMLMFSPSANVLYDIDLNNPDSLDYQGSVDLYVDGRLVQADSISVTGETRNSELSGSFSGGSGFGTGSFEVAFDQDNNTGAGSDFSRIEAPNGAKWQGDLHSVDTVEGSFAFYPDGDWGGGNNQVPACQFAADIGVVTIPSSLVNIFQLSNEVEDLVNCNYVAAGYTGFAAVINVSGTDDGLLFAMAGGTSVDGTFSVFSIMDRP